MRRSLFYSALLVTVLTFSSVVAFAQQSQQINLNDLKTPNSPGFQILDISPSSISRPTNPQALAASIMNVVGSGNSIPKNFAFEVSPYWYFKPVNATVYKYLNVRNPDDDQKHNNIGTGIYNKLSVSLASSYSDSTSGSLLKNTNYVAFGLRTNLLTLRSESQQDQLQKALQGRHDRQRAINLTIHSQEVTLRNKVDLIKDSLNKLDSTSVAWKQMNIELSTQQAALDTFENNKPNAIEKALGADQQFQQYTTTMTSLASKPLFQLDAAYATSVAFTNNTYANRRFNRSGVWLTATFQGLSFKKDRSDNLALMLLGRLIWDNALKDTAKNVFQETTGYDLGARLDYTVGKFNLSVEHLNRIYSDKSLNTNRTVAIIQYKLNTNLYLMGTFGQNFGNFNNVFTLLGINWGFGSSPLSL